MAQFSVGRVERASNGQSAQASPNGLIGKLEDRVIHRPWRGHFSIPRLVATYHRPAG